MPDALAIEDKNFAEAFAAHEKRQRIYTGKVACLLVVFLMPAGIFLDYFVYPENLRLFLAIRLTASLLACGLLYLHMTEFGQKYYRLLGVPIALLPASVIAWMIYYSPQGPASPYYAGLNLIVLAVS